MSKEVSWHVELTLKSGQIESFQALTGEMVEAARSDSGVLSYQRFVSNDGTLIHVYERYADSAAALTHPRNFAKNFSSRYLTMVERRRFLVFGRPNDELRRLLNEFGAIYLRPFGDFAYWA